VIALGGIPNKTHVGHMGIDGRIFPAATLPEKRGRDTGHLDFMDAWLAANSRLASWCQSARISRCSAARSRIRNQSEWSSRGDAGRREQRLPKTAVTLNSHTEYRVCGRHRGTIQA
jgi:hypothetical protein